MEEVEKYGIRNVVEIALNRIDPEKNKSIHVSFDIDSLDPLEAPSTGTPGKQERWCWYQCLNVSHEAVS